jgi:hypothetical protein
VPEISPIGDQDIVFSADMTGDDEIYVMNSDGTNLSQVTHYPKTDEFFPRWSPNGDLIFFISWRELNNGERSEEYRIISTNGDIVSKIGALPGCRRMGLPIWSPDSSWVAIYCLDYVAIFSAEGNSLRTIQNTHWSSPLMIHWSPGGDLLGVRNDDTIKLMSSDGSITEIETDYIGRINSPDIRYGFDFSPDSNSLVYITAKFTLTTGGSFEVDPTLMNEINIESLSSRQVSPINPGIEFYSPYYVSGDLILVFGDTLTGDYHSSLFLLNTQSSELTELTPGVQLVTFSLSPKKQLVAYTFSEELWILDLALLETRFVTKLDEQMDSTQGIFWDWSSDETKLLLSDLVINLETGVVIRNDYYILADFR